MYVSVLAVILLSLFVSGIAFSLVTVFTLT